MKRTPILGIDFSGSANPGRNIWIARGAVTSSREIRVEETECARTRFGSSGIESLYEALINYLQSQDDAVIGLDFPFSLPKSIIEEDEWISFLEAFQNRFQDDDIGSYPAKLDLDGHPKREDDVRYGGQSPFSPQIRYMVFYGLRDFLWPLVSTYDVNVIPMYSRYEHRPALIEVYPAATFGRYRLYRTGYKGSGKKAKERRLCNFEGLKSIDRVDIDTSMKDSIEGSDNALDSVCAAVATGTAVLEGLDEVNNSIEGHIFV